MDCITYQAPLSTDFPGNNPGVGCHFLLQGIFPSQRSNPCFLHWQADSLPLSHLGSPLHLYIYCWVTVGFLGGSVVKNPPASAGDAGSIPGSGRSLGGGNGNPFQYSCLGNPMDRGAWWATIHGVTKSWQQLTDVIFTFCLNIL